MPFEKVRNAERFDEAAGVRRRAAPAENPAEEEVFPNGEMREQAVRLENEADAARRGRKVDGRSVRAKPEFRNP